MRLRALAGQQRLHAHLALGGAERDGGPVELAVARHLGALGAEDPRALVHVLPADVAQAGVLADDQLDDRVEHRLAVLGARQELLPDLGLGALVEHDQRAPVQRGARGVGDRGQQDRGLDAHAARHVDERAARPRGVVGGGEHVLVAGDDRAQVGLDQLGMALDREREREHDRAVLDRVGRLEHAPVDLAERDRALRRLEQRLHALGGGGVAVARRGGRERVRRVALQRGELPAGDALVARQVERGGQLGGARTALAEPLRLADRDRRVSQWSPPSGAR